MEIQEFALNRSNDVVHISEVQRGKDCDCHCAFCKEILVAKKGNKKRHHFSHYNKKVSCKYGRETGLHLAAKRIISQEKILWLPPSEISGENTIKVDRGGTVKVISVELENRVQNIIPDVVVTIGGKRIIIEIFVTHPIDEEKKSKIEQMRLSCIEIDLSSYKDETIEFEMLKRLLLRENGLSRWINDEWAKKVQSCLEYYTDELTVDGQGYVYPVFCINSGQFGISIEYWRCLLCPHCFKADIQDDFVNHIFCLSKVGPFKYDKINKKMGLD